LLAGFIAGDSETISPSVIHGLLGFFLVGICPICRCSPKEWHHNRIASDVRFQEAGNTMLKHAQKAGNNQVKSPGASHNALPPVLTVSFHQAHHSRRHLTTRPKLRCWLLKENHGVRRGVSPITTDLRGRAALMLTECPI
jgi:hypothetical protein